MCWIRLEFAPIDESGQQPDSIWITAGRWKQDQFLFGTDDVTVIFDHTEATRAGIRTRAVSR